MSAGIGKYEVEGTIGRGASGTVYLAMNPDLAQRVAIKELAPVLAGDPAFIDRFRDEARVMARLDHPNAVRVFDFLEPPPAAYLVMEFVDGASLREVLSLSGRLSGEQAAGVLKGALQGLGHAHGLGLVHRDVKPENLLCDREGVSKLADFGLAMPAAGAGPGAAGFLSEGTPLYMSPEMIRGEPVDLRSDIYACGALLFELLTGRPPYRADSALAVMRKHLEDPVPSARRVARAVPAGVAKVAARAMAKLPADRHQTAGEFLAELEQAASRDYGADWESRASIKAAVATAIAAGAQP